MQCSGFRWVGACKMEVVYGKNGAIEKAKGKDKLQNSGNISFHVEVSSSLNQLTGVAATVEVRISLHMEKDVFMYRH